MMLHPSRCCAQGVHLVTEIRPGVKRCVWCGTLELAASPDVGTTPTPTPSAAAEARGGQGVEPVNNPRDATTVREPVNGTTELDARFRKCARTYAAQSAALVHWQHSGNKLPEVYR